MPSDLERWLLSLLPPGMEWSLGHIPSDWEPVIVEEIVVTPKKKPNKISIVFTNGVSIEVSPEQVRGPEAE